MPKRFFCEVKDELIMKICEHIKDQKNRSLMCQEDSSECRTAQFILESIFDKMEIYYYKEYVTSPSFAYSSDSEGDIDAEYGDEKEGLSKQDFISRKGVTKSVKNSSTTGRYSVRSSPITPTPLHNLIRDLFLMLLIQ